MCDLESWAQARVTSHDLKVELFLGECFEGQHALESAALAALRQAVQ